MSLVYLRPNLKIEPIIWGWYAWSYLIPPHTASCNIVNRHIKIMESFIEAPDVHTDASKNKKFTGGPFVDLDVSDLAQISILLESTKKQCNELIKLESDIKQLDRDLQKNATGYTQEMLYPLVPNSLKGMVELVYNLNSHPSIRFIEPFIYQKYFSSTTQSISLSILSNDYRPFVLSTPRITRANEIHLKIPFDDDRLNALVSMRDKPKPYQVIQDKLNIPEEQSLLFKSFFTCDPPFNQDRNYHGDSIRLRYFGHACVLIETNQINILIDPFISYKNDTELPRFTYSDLPEKIDYVLLTHNHQDHVLFETLIQLKYKIDHIVVPKNLPGFLADPSLKLILKSLGFNKIIELEELMTLEIPEGKITGIPFLGEHADLYVQSKIAHLVHLRDKKFLFAADSNNLEPQIYRHFFHLFGSVDYLFLGMECDGAPLTWLYGPLLSTPLKREENYSRKLSASDADKAWSLAKEIKAKNIYIYAMGQEPWLRHILGLDYDDDSLQIIESNKFIEKCLSKNIPAEKLFGKKQFLI